MHVPNPFGTYPLILRESNIPRYKNGELLFDYTVDDLYYVNKETGENKSISKIIYDQLIKAKVENSRIYVCKESEEVPVEEQIIPDIEDRSINNWYFNIFDAD